MKRAPVERKLWPWLDATSFWLGWMCMALIMIASMLGMMYAGLGMGCVL